MTFAPAGPDACALYREFIPHLSIPGSRYSYGTGPLDHSVTDGSDVIVVQRLSTPSNLKALMLLKEWGMKIVYDLDDNMWEIPAWNPAKSLMKSYQACLEQCAAISDIITVSTAALNVAVKRHLKLRKGFEVVTINNAMDFNLFGRMPREQRDYCKVGWLGTNTHTKDVAQVFDILVDVVKKNDNIRVYFAGLPSPERLKNNPHAIQMDFIPVSEFPARLASWRFDILLAPIEDNAFNRSKSNIKILEAAACGAVVLVSDVGSYRHFCSLDSELEYLVCRKRTDWENKIIALSNDPAMREHYSEVLTRVAKEHFNIVNVSKEWESVFDTVRAG